MPGIKQRVACFEVCANKVQAKYFCKKKVFFFRFDYLTRLSSNLDNFVYFWRHIISMILNEL